MKIREMMDRENFKLINEETLNSYYCDMSSSSILYVYPELNAIVTERPSKNVVRYIFKEYSIRSNILKVVIVRVYVWLCLVTRGLMASNKIIVSGLVSSETLIFPCNKKYRIFDFKNRYVDVIRKFSFPDNSLKHEIEFREKNKEIPFVPTLQSTFELGYREIIIDGTSLARIQNKSHFEKYRKMAYELIRSYSKNLDYVVSGKIYSEELITKIFSLSHLKVKDIKTFLNIVYCLSDTVKKQEFINITFSHGDLQCGNIWIENLTNRVIIIDWESWENRSVWYDKAVLFDGLRPGNINRYLNNNLPEVEKATVLLEDVIFKLSELNDLPFDYGEMQFKYYANELEVWVKSKLINLEIGVK